MDNIEPTPPDPNKAIIMIKAIVIYSDTNEYVVHADSGATPAAMLKRLTEGANPLWTLNPDTDRVEIIDFSIAVTKAAGIPRARVYGTQS